MLSIWKSLKLCKVSENVGEKPEEKTPGEWIQDKTAVLSLIMAH